MSKRASLVAMIFFLSFNNGDALSNESRNRFGDIAARTFTRMLWEKASSSEQKSSTKELRTQSINQSSNNYGILVPFVSNENGTRTNLGINNYAQSVVGKGTRPSANVLVALVNQQYDVIGTAQYTIRANELRQINDVIGSLGGGILTGYAAIFSDVPVTAWAAVIINQSSDPSIVMGIPDPQFKPLGGREGANGRLLIASSVKTGSFQSSLAVLNSGNKDGTFSLKIFDNAGNLLGTQSRFLTVGQMWLDNDVRRAYPGTFGDLLLEIVPEPNVNDEFRPEITAVSLVRSSSATAAFFPGTALPQSTSMGIAGIWSGSMTGNLFNLQVDMYVYQDRDLIYGAVDFLSGTAPFSINTNPYTFISGQMEGSDVVFHSQSNFLADDTLFAARIYGSFVGSTFQGTLLYIDGKGRADKGVVTLNRTGTIY